MFNVESLERAELGESLLTWIQTFNVEAPCQTVEDLTSGVVMAQVLQKIDPAYFDENWLNRIKTEVGDNWRLKNCSAWKKLKINSTKSTLNHVLISSTSAPLLNNFNSVTQLFPWAACSNV